MVARLSLAASVGLLALASMLLIACVAIVGPCDLARETSSWRLACEAAGTAIVMPPSTLQTIVPASGAKP